MQWTEASPLWVCGVCGSRMLKQFSWVVFLVQQSGCCPVLQAPKIWLLLKDLFPSSLKWLLTGGLSASGLLPSGLSLSYSSWPSSKTMTCHHCCFPGLCLQIKLQDEVSWMPYWQTCTASPKENLSCWTVWWGGSETGSSHVTHCGLHVEDHLVSAFWVWGHQAFTIRVDSWFISGTYFNLEISRTINWSR